MSYECQVAKMIETSYSSIISFANSNLSILFQYSNCIPLNYKQHSFQLVVTATLLHSYRKVNLLFLMANFYNDLVEIY